MRHSHGPEGPHHHHHGRGGRGPRPFDNGALRLLVLEMISQAPRHGYDVIKALEERSAGTYRPSPGTIYPIFDWLSEAGLIQCERAEGKRRLCQITPEGADYLRSHAAALRALAEAPQARRGQRWGGHAPEEIVAAMDRLKAALRARFDQGHAQAPITAIAAAIDAATDQITALPPLPETDMTQIITRHRHELRRRSLTVRSVARLTPQMIRIVLEGEDLADFVSLGADDHVKLFLPGAGDKPEMRDYTPRAYDTADRSLTLDFAVHEAGPATAWALQARPGDSMTIGGPRGSAVVAPVFDWYLLVGDETALPAMGRWVGELPETTRVITLAAVQGPGEEQAFSARAAHQAHWLHRAMSASADPAPLVAALAGLELPPGKGFVWIAAEAGVARALRQHMLETRQHPREWLKASGYWLKGQADAHEKLED